jgi:hypothetical protein
MLDFDEDDIDSFIPGWDADIFFDLEDLEDGFDNETLPFKLVSPDDRAALDDISAQDSRKLEVLSVTIKNDCVQTIYIAIIYRDTGGQLVHKGWYTIPSQNHVTFSDVTESRYSMYAQNSDGSFKWGGDSSSTYCVEDGKCYKDFSLPSSSTTTTQHLYCNSDSGPSPTPASPTATPVTVTGRAAEWVDSHNVRRASFHAERGKDPINVQWSQKLADSAQGYAQKLISVGGSDQCYIAHNYQGDSWGGENIASSWGSVYELPSPESVLYRWFEGEADEIWPANGVSQIVVVWNV